MKNALRVEYSVTSISRMLPVWKQLEEGGKLRRLLGRDVAILEVGYQTPRVDSLFELFGATWRTICYIR